MRTLKKYTLLATVIGTFSWAQSTALQSVGPYNRSLASDTSYVHAFSPSLGFDRSKPVFAGDYEYKISEHLGAGGAFYFTPAKKSKGYPRILGIGADAKIHAPLADIDLYVRPGIGFSFVDYRSTSGTDEDSVLISPFVGLGAVYRVWENVGMGFEYLSSFNWSDAEFPGSKHDFLLSAQIRF